MCTVNGLYHPLVPGNQQYLWLAVEDAKHRLAIWHGEEIVGTTTALGRLSRLPGVVEDPKGIQNTGRTEATALYTW